MEADIDAFKERTRSAWSRGSYGELSPLLAGAARELVDACAVSAGQEVLDVGAGDGNVAALAAGKGAKVVACDLTPAMVDLGSARTAAEGLEVEWLVADAEALPFDDLRFDCAASAFAAMFAPRPERVAAELLRVVRLGGTVGMTSWTPDSFQGRSFEITRRYLPPPEGVPAATDWGDEAIARNRLESLGARVEVRRLSVPFRFESVDHMARFFAINVGPAVAAREQLDPDRHERMAAETRELALELDCARDGTLAFDAEYLLIVARRPG